MQPQKRFRYITPLAVVSAVAFIGSASSFLYTFREGIAYRTYLYAAFALMAYFCIPALVLNVLINWLFKGKGRMFMQIAAVVMFIWAFLHVLKTI